MASGAPYAKGSARLPVRPFRIDYIMEAGIGMAATVAPDMPTPAEIAADHWLSEIELAVEMAPFGCRAFQNGRFYARRRSVITQSGR